MASYSAKIFYPTPSHSRWPIHLGRKESKPRGFAYTARCHAISILTPPSVWGVARIHLPVYFMRRHLIYIDAHVHPLFINKEDRADTTKDCEEDIFCVRVFSTVARKRDFLEAASSGLKNNHLGSSFTFFLARWRIDRPSSGKQFFSGLISRVWAIVFRAGWETFRVMFGALMSRRVCELVHECEYEESVIELSIRVSRKIIH